MTDTRETRPSPPGIAYRLECVSVRRFTEYEDTRADEPVNLGYKVGLSFERSEERPLQVIVSIRLRALMQPEGAAPESLVEMEIACAFTFKDASSLTADTGNVRVPEALLATFVGVALSTARGVLIGRSRFALLADCPLPILSPLGMIREYLEMQPLEWVAPAR